MAMPRYVYVIDVHGKRLSAKTFDEPITEGQRKYFEQEEARVTSWVRWGIETREGDLTWQMAFLAMTPLWYGLAVQIARAFE